MDVNKKRQEEQVMVGQMIQVYCRGSHRGKKELHKNELCGECRKLLEYAAARTAKCPFMETKTFCSACEVHCYAPEKREAIRRVMKYAGPRMLLYHPLTAVKHIWITLLRRSRSKA